MKPHRGLTIADVAAICGVAKPTVRSWLYRGHLHRNRRGLIDPHELLRYLDERGAVGQRRHAPSHTMN